MSTCLRAASASAALFIAMAAPAHASGSLETINRSVHALNAALHANVLVPVAREYHAWVPAAMRHSVANALSNLREPITAVSSGLQGDFPNAGTAVVRFAVNTVLGLGGLFDPATTYGLVRQPQDLGNTLCAYGVPEGAYMVLPFYGPATLRDLAGVAGLTAAGVATFGGDWLTVALADQGLRTVIDAPTIAALDVWAVDPYAQQKSAYLQHRRANCGTGAANNDADGPGFADLPRDDGHRVDSPPDGAGALFEGGADGAPPHRRPMAEPVADIRSASRGR